MFVLERKRFGAFRSPIKVVAMEKKKELRDFIRNNPRFADNSRILTVTKHGATAATYNVRSFAGLTRQAG